LRDAADDRRRTELPLDGRIKARLDHWRGRLPATLKQFHNSAAAITGDVEAVSWKQVDAAVRQLRRVAFDFLGGLAYDDKALSRVQEFLNAVFFPNWDTRRTPNRIHLVFDSIDQDLLSLPIEYLPVRFTDGPDEIKDLPSLQEAINAYAGFTAIVVRREEGRDSDSQGLAVCSGNGRIPVKVIRNTKFYRSPDNAKASEVLWLEGKTRLLDVEAAWPDDDTLADLADEVLARCLRDPYRPVRGDPERRDYSDQIQHISCHYLDSEEALELREKGDGLSAITVRASGLRGWLTELASCASPSGVSGNSIVAGPLIFLNTCSGGAVDPTGDFSLLEMLQSRTPARAIIAPATYVHFPLAAAFARYVYEALLRGAPLGEAVHQARWDLLLTRANPFGILYGLHGDPDLRIDTGTWSHGISERAAN
jgi:hypothetical protein